MMLHQHLHGYVYFLRVGICSLPELHHIKYTFIEAILPHAYSTILLFLLLFVGEINRV